MRTSRQPLHTRDDEEPDVDESHMIAWAFYGYKGCFHCGHEDHDERHCPNRA